MLSPSCPAPPSSRASRASLSSGCTSSKDSSIPSTVSDKVHCVCGAMRNDGKPMVECTKCGASSHLQCARLTQRTAKKAVFVCHRCRGNTNDPSGAASLASRRKGVVFADPVAKGKSTKPGLKKTKSIIGNPPIYSSTSTTPSPTQSIVTNPFPSILPSPSVLSTSYSQPVASVSPGPTASMNIACSQPIVSELLGIDDTRVECTINTCAVQSMASDTSTCTSTTNGRLMAVLPMSTSNSPVHPNSASASCLRSEIDTKLSKLESVIRVCTSCDNLSTCSSSERTLIFISFLRERCDRLSLSYVKRPYSAAPSPHHSRHSTSNSLSQKSHSNSAKVLPFRIIWGTRRNCSSQVIHKAICALIPKDDWSCVTVKGSSRQRGTRHMWWHTLIAPAEVMQRIDSTWHILEARSSWSLRPSLSSSQISAQHGAISTDTRESAKVACEVSTAPSVEAVTSAAHLPIQPSSLPATFPSEAGVANEVPTISLPTEAAASTASLHTLSSSLPVSSPSGVISTGSQETAGVIHEVALAPLHTQPSALPITSLSEATFLGTQETVGVVPEPPSVSPTTDAAASAAFSHSLSSSLPVSPSIVYFHWHSGSFFGRKHHPVLSGSPVKHRDAGAHNSLSTLPPPSIPFSQPQGDAVPLHDQRLSSLDSTCTCDSLNNSTSSSDFSSVKLCCFNVRGLLSL